MKIAALDIAIGTTGIVDHHGNTSTVDGKRTKAELADIKSNPQLRIERYRTTALKIVEAALDWTDWPDPNPTPPTDLVAIEKYAFAAKGTHKFDAGELGYAVRSLLMATGVAFIEVNPADIKTFATGRGNASKLDVTLAAARRLDYRGNSEDEADALWLWHLTNAAAGQTTATVPCGHRKPVAHIAEHIENAMT